MKSEARNPKLKFINPFQLCRQWPPSHVLRELIETRSAIRRLRAHSRRTAACLLLAVCHLLAANSLSASTTTNFPAIGTNPVHSAPTIVRIGSNTVIAPDGASNIVHALNDIGASFSSLAGLSNSSPVYLTLTHYNGGSNATVAVTPNNLTNFAAWLSTNSFDGRYLSQVDWQTWLSTNRHASLEFVTNAFQQMTNDFTNAFQQTTNGFQQTTNDTAAVFQRTTNDFNLALSNYGALQSTNRWGVTQYAPAISLTNTYSAYATTNFSHTDTNYYWTIIDAVVDTATPPSGYVVGETVHLAIGGTPEAQFQITQDGGGAVALMDGGYYSSSSVGRMPVSNDNPESSGVSLGLFVTWLYTSNTTDFYTTNWCVATNAAYIVFGDGMTQTTAGLTWNWLLTNQVLYLDGSWNVCITNGLTVSGTVYFNWGGAVVHGGLSADEITVGESFIDASGFWGSAAHLTNASASIFAPGTTLSAAVAPGKYTNGIGAGAITVATTGGTFYVSVPTSYAWTNGYALVNIPAASIVGAPWLSSAITNLLAGTANVTMTTNGGSVTVNVATQSLAGLIAAATATQIVGVVIGTNVWTGGGVVGTGAVLNTITPIPSTNGLITAATATNISGSVLSTNTWSGGSVLGTGAVLNIAAGYAPTNGASLANVPWAGIVGAPRSMTLYAVMDAGTTNYDTIYISWPTNTDVVVIEGTVYSLHTDWECGKINGDSAVYPGQVIQFWGGNIHAYVTNTIIGMGNLLARMPTMASIGFTLVLRNLSSTNSIKTYYAEAIAAPGVDAAYERVVSEGAWPQTNLIGTNLTLSYFFQTNSHLRVWTAPRW